MNIPTRLYPPGLGLALCLCGMISIHGGLTLLYLSITAIGYSAQEVLAIFLSGCLAVLLIPLVGVPCERVVQVAMAIKILLGAYALLAGSVLIVPEALNSGLIASSSFYFAMREISRVNNGKWVASILILIINVESLLLYSALGWLSESVSRSWLTLAYCAAIVLPLFYISRSVSIAPYERASLRQILAAAKGLSAFNVLCYMLAVFSVNCFNVSIHRWAELNTAYWWGSVSGMTCFYIVGVLASVGILSSLKIDENKLLMAGLMGISLLGFGLSNVGTEASPFMPAIVVLLGVMSTVVMSSIAASLARTNTTLSRLLVVGVLAALQVCLIIVIRVAKVFSESVVNEWQAIAMLGCALALVNVHLQYFKHWIWKT